MSVLTAREQLWRSGAGSGCRRATCFPAGAFVEAVRDFEKSTAEKFAQAKDEETGGLLWSVLVLDADETAPKNTKTMVVKITAPVQPVPPRAVAGLPFRPVEFEGLTVSPYLDDKRNRVACSLQARVMRPPVARDKATSADGKAA
ncbi:MAG: plasmid replication, integration and excision activator [Pseudonocardiaceae bacterium]